MSHRTRGGLRLRSATALIAVVALVLAACGGDDAPAPAPEPSAPSETPEAPEPADDDLGLPEAEGPLEIGRPGGPRPIWASLQYHIARDFGYYFKWGVDVRIREFRSGGAVTQATHTGELDGGYTGSDPFFAAVARGTNVVAIKGQDNVDWNLVTRDPDIQSCEDMAGTTSGAQAPGDARYVVLQLLLESCGLTIDQVDTIDTSGNHVGTLVAGVLDTHVLQTDEIVWVRHLTGDDWRVLVRLIDVGEPLHYGIFVANRDSVQEKRGAMVRMMAAHIEAIRFMHDPANRDEVIAYITSIVEQDDPELVEEILETLLAIPLWQLDDPGLDRQTIENSIAQGIAVGNIEQAWDYEDGIDLSIWEEAFAFVQAQE